MKNEEREIKNFANELESNIETCSKNISEYVSKLIEQKVNVVASIKQRARGGKSYLSLTSDSIKTTPKVFKELIITDFGSDIYFDKEEETYLVWLNIHFDFEHFSGGTNGCEIGVVYVNSKGEIILTRDTIN